ncbi:MAG: hypothetical protein HZB51_02520 [Chloroflexi bacterium]|nr:hypothetical protein [Chloroflexota bacterium]
MSELNKRWSIGAVIIIYLGSLLGCQDTIVSQTLPTKSAPTRQPTPTVSAPPTRTVVPSVAVNFTEIDAGDYFFYPSVLTVTVGTTVRWNHVGSTGHDVNAVDRSWGTTLIPLASYFEYTFTREGIFDYACILHSPGMRGTIIIVPKP